MVISLDVRFPFMPTIAIDWPIHRYLDHEDPDPRIRRLEAPLLA
jgi:hypothetical protein